MIPQPNPLAEPFHQRWPWVGPDLQTLRDTLRPDSLRPDQGRPLPLAVGADEQLLVMVDEPAGPRRRGLVLLVHGLAGDSNRQGVRRLGQLLQHSGFAIWRLNLRGAGPGRPLARGSYAAACTADLLPVFAAARRRCGDLPLYGVGLSLGGTILLNALLEQPKALDGLVCVSSPLDLRACCQQIEAPRNWLYQRWLLRRLLAQALADPSGLDSAERDALAGPDRPRTIRAFDAVITAPRWGYRSVGHYYAAASPGPALLARARLQSVAGELLPPALLLHAADDPWVPAAATCQLAEALRTGRGALPWQVWITPHGGHNGFHGRRYGQVQGLASPDQSLPASWADQQVTAWLLAQPEALQPSL